MKIFKIRKKSGEFRKIYAPNYTEKWKLRLICIDLNEQVKKKCNHNIVHGFIQGHSPITNALAHVGKLYTLSMDLKDFFDSIKYEMLPTTIENYYKCFKDGAARQGLPTSPAISNLVCIEMDNKLLTLCEPQNIIYTRYADDLSFSGNDLAILKDLKEKIKNIVEECGFTLNPEKTRIQSAQYGRRNITGVNVDHTIHPTRKIKRRLRAALHQKNQHEAKGLAEWCKLKPPNPKGGCNITKVQKNWAKHLTIKLLEKGK